MKTNCHTHTTYCDGKNTAEEMILAAIEKGFTCLGFSGHSPMNHESIWGMSEEGAEKYMDELADLAEKYEGKLDVLCGIELDADYENIDINDFDYVIGSVHSLNFEDKIYEMDNTAEVLQACIDEKFGGDRDCLAEAYFKKLADFIESEEFIDVVGHIDLITKFNEQTPVFDENSERYQKAAKTCVDRILEAVPEIVFEVNTGAMYRKGNSKPYPAEFILKYIKEKGGKITITSDAHCTEALDYKFPEAVDYCRKCGFEIINHLTPYGFEEEKI